MSLSIHDFRCKLITKIVFAASQDEVKRYIDTAMKALSDRKVNGHLVARFVEKTLKDLEGFSPADHGSPQWANIRIARIQLSKAKRSGPEAAHH